MMNRRNFIKNCSLLVSGLAVSKTFSMPLRKASGESSATESFSLNLVTDEPDLAIGEIEEFLQNRAILHKQFKFAEYPLAGNHIADIVWIQNQQLVDYRKQEGELSRQIFAIAQRLGLPRRVDTPVLLKFSIEETGQKARRVHVFSQNKLVQRFSINESQEAFQIPGAKGQVTLSIRNQSAKIVSASCKHKTCMKMGSIHAPGQNLVCIPNQVRIAIAGENLPGVDGVAY